MRPGDDGINRFFTTGNGCLDAAIAAIADPTGHSQIDGGTYHRITKTDPLDAP